MLQRHHSGRAYLPGLTAALLLVSLPCAAEASQASDVDRAFTRLYNFDFAGAHRILDGYIARQQAEPFPYAVRAAAYLFEELNRLGILESEFFADNSRIASKKKLRPDPAVKGRFTAAVEAARARAATLLAANASDSEALFTHCVASGLVTDYVSLIEKRQLASLGLLKEANRYCVRFRQVEPERGDAYLGGGVTEYIVGSAPFLVRWFIRFDQVQGNKEMAVKDLERVASSGRYLGGFAKILLATIHLREDRPDRSATILADLTRTYPENALFRLEYEKISLLAQRNRESRSEVTR